MGDSGPSCGCGQCNCCGRPTHAGHRWQRWQRRFRLPESALLNPRLEGPEAPAPASALNQWQPAWSEKHSRLYWYNETTGKAAGICDRLRPPRRVRRARRILRRSRRDAATAAPAAAARHTTPLARLRQASVNCNRLLQQRLFRRRQPRLLFR